MSDKNFLIEMDHISDVNNISKDYYEDAINAAETCLND